MKCPECLKRLPERLLKSLDRLLKWLICEDTKSQADLTQAQRNSRKALRMLGRAIALGLLAVVPFACQTSNVAAFLGVLSTGAFTGGASLMVGGTLGFIFGVPRTRPKEPSSGNATGQGNESEKKNEGAPAANGGQVAASVEGNTNLEEISDWLTKMLVGVGLTQLYKVPGHMKVLANYVARGLVNVPQELPLGLAVAQTFALGLIVYFLFVGFLFGFLWTRFVLTGALTRDALETLRGELLEPAERTDAIATMLEREAKRWKLVHRQLQAREDDVAVLQEELDKEVLEASEETRGRIFYEAAGVRRATWRDDKTRMERTIPIFRALCHADTEDKYHANHGQLGFALKDKTLPDYEEAEKELTKAIEIRDRVEPGKVLPYYEFNRAICRIHLHRPVSDIEPDLRKAYPNFQRIIPDVPEIATWQKENNVTDLGTPPQS